MEMEFLKYDNGMNRFYKIKFIMIVNLFSYKYMYMYIQNIIILTHTYTERSYF